MGRKDDYQARVDYALAVIGYDEATPRKLREVRAEIVRVFLCSPMAAYRAATKAVRIRDGGEVAGEWGGRRSDAGRPRKESAD